jgi:hypothetical protein
MVQNAVPSHDLEDKFNKTVKEWGKAYRYMETGNAYDPDKNAPTGIADGIERVHKSFVRRRKARNMTEERIVKIQEEAPKGKKRKEAACF